MKVIVDESMCIGAGQCVLAAPGIFDQREDDGIAIVLIPEPPPERYDDVIKAVRQCPSAAIRIEK